MSDEAAIREAIEVAIARRREVFALSDLARAADGYSVKFRVGIVDVVRTAIAAGVFHDFLRLDTMLDGVRHTFQALALFSVLPKEAAMDTDALRLLIRQKLQDGRLPYDHIPRVWGGPGAFETCDACESPVTERQMVMEGIALAGGRKPIQMHVRCFGIWDEERRDTVA